ncbi:molybdopterin-dependent oxidoreductase [Millisia brevis]|uniref:molybdopterin-dependent oxidoreductase n=1 Tax=Millisia brevis TaxID=264148 RepID=UPI0008370747|nr:molybdopterin-dependent oxidoreductase [Millisia brevis]
MTEPQWQKTACILCECNCGLEVLLDDRQLVKIRGDKAHPQSQGYTCEKPLRLDRYQNGPHRITSPMRRRPDGTYEEIDWETALDEIAAKLQQVKDTHGGERIFYYGGGGQGNHLQGAYGRALIGALGVRFISNALAQEKTGEAWVDRQIHGNHTIGDFEHSEVTVFIGKNPWQSHGVARARPTLREIARDPDRHMIVIDPRRSETADLADIHLQVKPGTDAWCMAAIAGTLVQEKLYNAAWLAEHAVDHERVLEAFAAIDIPRCARICGVPEELLRDAGRMIGTASSVATYEDLGIQHAPNSTLTAYLDKMPWLLTGSFAKPGGQHIHSWLFPLAGAWHPVPRSTSLPAEAIRRRVGLALMRFGAGPLRKGLAAAGRTRLGSRAGETVARMAMSTFFDPVGVATAAPIAAALGRFEIEDATPVTGARVIAGLIPATSIPEEILTDHPDRMRALWIDASNPVHSLPGTTRFAEAMRAVDISVVVEVAMTETARQADHVLPAASQFEKYEASLFTLHFPHNTFQLRRPLMAPLPGTRQEVDIYVAIIDRLGVVPDGIVAELRTALNISRHAFALSLFSTLRSRPELAALTPYLLYRTLGATLGEGRETVALVWGLAHLSAIAQPEAVARAGFTGSGFDRGEELFEAILAHPEGVVFTEDAYDDARGYLQHPDGKFHLAIPELLDELERVLAQEPVYTSAEFPFILSAGERRAFTANVIIRNPEWRRRDAEGALRLSPADATRLGVATGDRVRVVTAGGAAVTPVEINEMMQDGHISLPNGLGVIYPDGEQGESVVGVALNQLTSGTRRDRFFGSPWHKNVPARIEPIAEPV